MLVARKSKNFNVFPTQNVKIDWIAALLVVDFHLRMLFSMEKFFFVVEKHRYKAIFFQN